MRKRFLGALGNVLCIAFYLMGYGVRAQDAQIRLGATTIALNEGFSISLVLNNEQLRSYSPFPEIPGFQKRGISSQTSTNIVNGQIAFSQSIIQNYAPTKEGKFKLGSFSMEVNGKKIGSNGATITVTPPKQAQRQDPFAYDPFEEFFGRGGSKEYIDVKEDAFFAFTTSKDHVYVGEGFTGTLAFYVSDQNKAEMQFFELGNQLQDILKKIKPSNCWVENFNIEEIQPEKVEIDGKGFTQYKLFRATYFPLNKEPVLFPSVGIKMIKYKVAKNPGFFGFGNKQQDFKTFYTKPKIVRTKSLPPHPMGDAVSVGVFKLEESALPKGVPTGKSFNYNFKIVGEGNISSIQAPAWNSSQALEVYPPNIYQDINRTGGHVTGTKSFNYFIVPKEPGKYPLKDQLFWVYFDTKRSKYDTLKPKGVLIVTGESSRDNMVQSAGQLDSFTGLIKRYSNEFIDFTFQEYIRWIANIAIGILTVLVIFISFKK